MVIVTMASMLALFLLTFVSSPGAFLRFWWPLIGVISRISLFFVENIRQWAFWLAWAVTWRTGLVFSSAFIMDLNRFSILACYRKALSSFYLSKIAAGGVKAGINNTCRNCVQDVRLEQHIANSLLCGRVKEELWAAFATARSTRVWMARTTTKCEPDPIPRPESPSNTCQRIFDKHENTSDLFAHWIINWTSSSWQLVLDP